MTPSSSAPRSIGNATLIYKTAMGLLGGLSGTVVLLMVALIGNWIFPTLLEGLDAESAPKSPLILFLVLVMVFLGTIVGNLISLTLMTVVDRQKYHNLSTPLTQAFMFNLLMFVFSIPVYLFLQNASLSTISFVIGIHLTLTAFMSSIVIEILSEREHILVTLYGSAFAMLLTLATSLVSFILLGNGPAKALFVFLVFPMTWTFLGLCGAAAEMLYRWAYDVYGVDFLSTSAVYETRPVNTKEEGAEATPDASLQ